VVREPVLVVTVPTLKIEPVGLSRRISKKYRLEAEKKKSVEFFAADA
jgi:hypothetical protein